MIAVDREKQVDILLHPMEGIQEEGNFPDLQEVLEVPWRHHFWGFLRKEAPDLGLEQNFGVQMVDRKAVGSLKSDSGKGVENRETVVVGVKRN